VHQSSRREKKNNSGRADARMMHANLLAAMFGPLSFLHYGFLQALYSDVVKIGSSGGGAGGRCFFCLLSITASFSVE
jgi:hypothetical protein